VAATIDRDAMPTCPSCAAEVLDIDVKCKACGANLGPTGAHRMVGTTVLGQYHIIDVLGQGGMSVVFRAKHTMTEQEVALKVLPPDLAAYSQVKSRFLEEARALAQLDHPNIVHLYNFGQENGSHVLAMQYVHGQTWERMILELGRQEWPTAVRIAIDVLRALEYAHGRGVVHRDMKPSNVLVRDDDGTATVMDFGIAKMTTSTRLTATGQTMGTVRYMSPEQVRGQEVDARSDIYSLGATLYEAVTGETPFDGNTHFEIMSKHLSEPVARPSSHGVELPAPLEAAIVKSLSKRADDRFASARDFRKELEAMLREADVGHAETLRMSRETVADARVRKPFAPKPAPPAPSSPGTPGPDAVTRPQRDNVTGLADRLEPGLTGTEPVIPRRRTGLWLGLGALVLAAAGGVAFVAMRDRGGKVAAADAAPPPDVKEFQPAGVTWHASGDFAVDGITVRIAAPFDWPPSEVAAAYRKVRRALPAVQAKKAPDAKRYPERITIQVVPRDTLCDPRTFESGETVECKDLFQYFRIGEKTLLVVAERDQLEPILAEAVAEIVCVYNDLGACFRKELVEAVENMNGGTPN
jgi:serine/threonine protein kinase